MKVNGAICKIPTYTSFSMYFDFSGFLALASSSVIHMIPDNEHVYVWVPFAGLVLWSAVFIAGGLWIRGVRTPYTRKVFHFIIFSTAAVIQFTAGPKATAVYGAVVFVGVLYASLRSTGYPFYEALARPTDKPHRTLHVIVPLFATALGGVAANILAGPLAPVGYLVGGWGDAVGEPVGTRWGKHRFKVPTLAGVSSTRSLEGCGAVFVMSYAAAFLALSLLGEPSIAARALAIAAAATVVESVAPHGLDNFFVQATGAWVASWALLA